MLETSSALPLLNLLAVTPGFFSPFHCRNIYQYIFKTTENVHTFKFKKKIVTNKYKDEEGALLAF